MQEVYQWIYGALTILFIGLFYVLKKLFELEKKQNTMETTLPVISAQLDELNKTLKLFLKQEIDTLKDIAQSNRERNDREEDRHYE